MQRYRCKAFALEIKATRKRLFDNMLTNIERVVCQRARRCERQLPPLHVYHPDRKLIGVSADVEVEYLNLNSRWFLRSVLLCEVTWYAWRFWVLPMLQALGLDKDW